MKTPISRGGRRGLVFALAIAILLYPASADAQGINGKRKWIYAIIGATVTAVPAFIATNSKESLNSNCNSTGCVTAVAALLGAGVGFLIGREKDANWARRMSAGPSIRYDFHNVALGLVPDRMTGFPGGAAVIGLGGARIVRRDGSSTSVAVGVRGIEDVAVLPRSNLMVLSTPTSLIAFPVAGESAQGFVIDNRGGGSMEALHEELAVAGFDSLRILELDQTDGDIAVKTLAAFENFDYVSDISFNEFGRTTWVLIEDRLSAYSASLDKISETVLPAAGRTVRARGDRLAVAAGSSGAYVLDATDPAAPRVVREFTGVRFAYAADLSGNLLYVAAGIEGMVVVDVSGPQPEVVGVAREVKFASDVMVADESSVWILDREGRQIQIAEFNLSTSATGDGSGSID